MARLAARLARLEARRMQRPGPRCDTCRAWPELPVIWPGRPHPMDGHERCPVCGWAPRHILAVVYEAPVAA